MRIHVAVGLAAIAVLVANATLGLAEEEIQIVSPNFLISSEGNSALAADCCDVPFRGQRIYPASDFDALPEGGARLVRFALRPDKNVIGTRTITGSWELRFSTTETDPQDIDLTYANNIGPNETIVFADGPFTVQTDNVGPANGPREFDYVVNLQQPFLYDPSQGNLLFDIITDGWSDGLEFDIQDVSSITAVGGGRDALVAEDKQEWYPATQFIFVPEPSTGDCDKDGLLNAEDLSCVTTIEARDAVLGALNTLPGDLDGNGEVAFADFLVLSTNFNQVLPSYTDGNIDLKDGVVFADFLVLSTNFGKTPSDVAAVPEPNALLLVCIGLFGAAELRRQRMRG